ncbi:hypothetical protein, partial [Streptomyces sp. SID10115]|uniref:hypothetical protein n=2 Tax=unclassified Streptomyces TaxID=2593676 RepID=UPI001F14AE80
MAHEDRGAPVTRAWPQLVPAHLQGVPERRHLQRALPVEADRQDIRVDTDRGDSDAALGGR